MPRRRKPPRAGALTELPPLRIAAQIATLQALYYLGALVLMLFTTLVGGGSFDFDMLLGWDRVRGDTTQGWLMAFVWLLDGGLFMSVAIVALIARSKLVPDFALTVHLLHLVFTTLYARSLPRNPMWWATMLGASAIAVGLGIWGCRCRELQPVFFLGGRVLGSGTCGPCNSNRASAAEEGRLLREPGDGADGADADNGAGEYEMGRVQSTA